MESIWKTIIETLEQDNPVVLAVVIAHKGSSPGKKGFKMAVSSKGVLSGSVGGGSMEYGMIKKAIKGLSEGLTNPVLFQMDHLHQESAKRSGLICSGTQWVAFYLLKSNDLPLIRSIYQLEKYEKEDTLLFNEKGIFIKKRVEKTDQITLSDKRWLLTENPGKKNTVYVFGGGHVSLALSKLLKTLDFKIKVFENRQDLSTFKKNRYADEKKVIHYEEAGSFVPEGEHVYVVIMTYAHQYDLLVIKQMLSKKVKYLGMMGSANKVRSVKEQLAMEGQKTDDFNKKVHAPIGLSIKSITPAEIAVSIAAELIAVKNG